MGEDSEIALAKPLKWPNSKNFCTKNFVSKIFSGDLFFSLLNAR
ncbi:MAG: hypothetical protein ABR909_13835 [Candidatus Bathyarchaeia archaeon]|jgi:hypothetical protein